MGTVQATLFMFTLTTRSRLRRTSLTPPPWFLTERSSPTLGRRGCRRSWLENPRQFSSSNAAASQPTGLVFRVVKYQRLSSTDQPKPELSTSFSSLHCETLLLRVPRLQRLKHFISSVRRIL